MPRFSPETATSLGGPGWQLERRLKGIERMTQKGFPSEKEEVWRYTPIDRFNPEAFAPALAPSQSDAAALFLKTVIEEIGGAAGSAFSDAGFASIATDTLPKGAHLFLASQKDGFSSLGSVLDGGDAFVALNDAFSPDCIVVTVERGVVVEKPIVIVHWVDDEVAADQASFPRVYVHLEEDAQASVIEVFGGAKNAHGGLVVPVSELSLDRASRLSYISVQEVGMSLWSIGRMNAQVATDASLSTFTLGLGGAYARLRSDVAALGSGASTALRSAYLGVGNQIHDIRTLQDHRAGRSMSDLTCKGAVTDSSRSVYTGMIRVRKGATKTEAFQRNNNLVLHPGAHADSVPNLDIEENDVRCSHASTVGPVDEEQRYYLESRGIEPKRAERLIVSGFFQDLVAGVPIPAAHEWLSERLALRIDAALAPREDGNE